MKKLILYFAITCCFFSCKGYAEQTQEKDPVIRQLVLKLHDIGAVKFGSYTLKSGIISPIYIDLRVIISDPQLLTQIGEAMWRTQSSSYDCICGVPYTALPIATAISLEHNVPMVMRRKEVKNYGTKKQIEGIFETGQTCLVIEDLVTSGQSVLQTIESLEKEELQVTDVVVFIDREQGGRQKLQELGYTLHSVLTLPTLLKILEEENKIDSLTYSSVIEFLQTTQTK